METELLRNQMLFSLVLRCVIAGSLFKMLLENKINILTEIAVVRFSQLLNSLDHIFVERDTYFALQGLLCIHVTHYKEFTEINLISITK